MTRKPSADVRFRGRCSASVCRRHGQRLANWTAATSEVPPSRVHLAFRANLGAVWRLQVESGGPPLNEGKGKEGRGACVCAEGGHRGGPPCGRQALTHACPAAVCRAWGADSTALRSPPEISARAVYKVAEGLPTQALGAGARGTGQWPHVTLHPLALARPPLASPTRPIEGHRLNPSCRPSTEVPVGIKAEGTQPCPFQRPVEDTTAHSLCSKGRRLRWVRRPAAAVAEATPCQVAVTGASRPCHGGAE